MLFNNLLYYLAKFGGWSSDTEEDVLAFYQERRGRVSLLVTGVVEDHHFSGWANLCLGKKLTGVQRLVFNPPRQVSHPDNHHSMHPGVLNSCYLDTSLSSDFMGPGENLAEAIVLRSLPE